MSYGPYVCDRRHPPAEMEPIGSQTTPDATSIAWWQCPHCNHIQRQEHGQPEGDQEALF